MPKILIAEEATPLRETLAHHLRADGFEVFTAPSGDESLRLAGEQPPDLLILSLQLPNLDNQTLRQLLQRCGTAPVLMHLTHSNAGSQADLFGPTKLLGRARALLGQAASGTPQPVTTLAAGDLALDLLNRRATLAGTPLKLTQKEFDVLAELVRHRGQVVSRDQLLTRVWGQHRSESSHTVDVHIRWLREKIEPDPSTPSHILTIRGAGYQFSAYV